jgi:UDP-glucose 4-epimerase
LPAGSEPPILVLDSQRIRQVLGWRPQRSSLRQIVHDGWAWLGEQAARAR